MDPWKSWNGNVATAHLAVGGKAALHSETDRSVRASLADHGEGGGSREDDAVGVARLPQAALGNPKGST